VLGGIGSLRLSAKQVGNRDIFVLGASSSGVSHEGVPLTCESFHRGAEFLLNELVRRTETILEQLGRPI
jgi:hypothetical protein